MPIYSIPYIKNKTYLSNISDVIFCQILRFILINADSICAWIWVCQYSYKNSEFINSNRFKIDLGVIFNNSFKNVGLQWSTKFLCEMRKNDILSALEFICNLQKFVCVYTITDKSESWFNHVQFICPYTVWTNILVFFPSQTATKCFQWLIIYLHCLLCKLFRDVYFF